MYVLHACMHVCMHACMHSCTYVFVCMRMYTDNTIKIAPSAVRKPAAKMSHMAPASGTSGEIALKRSHTLRKALVPMCVCCVCVYVA